MNYRKGQHVICKYRGTGNGDLIVGEVKSVRTNGDVILTNLITGGRSVKHESVLTSRNLVVTKREAMRVVMAHQSHLSSAKKVAREAAVLLAQSKREPSEHITDALAKDENVKFVREKMR